MHLAADEIFGPPISAMNSPQESSGFDWGGLLQTAVKTAGSVYQAKTQADIAKAQAQAAASNPWPASFGGADPFAPPIFPSMQYPTQMRRVSQMPASNDSWIIAGIGAAAILGFLMLSR